MAYNFDCRLFSGYKPCRHKRPCDGCPHYDPVKERVGIISLEALGAVLRTTCLLQPIKRKYPNSHITWITMPSAKSLLDNNPLIDRLITFDATMQQAIATLEFDVLYAVDKSLDAGGLAQQIKAKRKFGFGINQDGVIIPLSPEAQYQYDVGLNDELKFRVNQKAETQQITETMGLTWQRDSYVLQLTDAEKAEAAKRRAGILQNKKGIIGFNTGCSNLFSYKKFTVERCVEVIAMWRQQFPDFVVGLYGGREDTERQEQMKQAFANDPMVVNTPTTSGLRSGMLWLDTANIVLSGDSLGMHIAIGLGKPVIAWFGLSCPQEIDLYGRGRKLLAKVGCSPCWKKTCTNEPKCYNEVPVGDIEAATRAVLSENKFV